MIRNFLFILLLLSTTVAFSQENGDSKYSFGVRGYNYLALPKILNQSTDRRYIHSDFSSYIIKFNDNLYSYRLNGSYLNQREQFPNVCADCEIAKGKIKDYSFKAGFEKNFTYTAIQPYLALDLGYRSNEFTGVRSSGADQSLSTFARKRGFTISPVFGVKVSPVKAISIFAEANAEFFYAWGKEESSYTDPSRDYQQKFQKGELLYNPVSVGIQLHLGRKN